jgi:inorganic triphosphatase YgiF
MSVSPTSSPGSKGGSRSSLHDAPAPDLGTVGVVPGHSQDTLEVVGWRRGSEKSIESSKNMVDAIPVEVEAKLLVPTASDLRAIGRLTHLGPYPLRSRGAVRLHSTYLDTPSLTLARHGVALRLRRQGRQWEATLKWAGQLEGDVHERPEMTVALPKAPALPFAPLPGPLHTQLAALVAGRQLSPILISEIHRRLFDVLPLDPTMPPEPIAELALDRVRLRGPANERLVEGSPPYEGGARGGSATARKQPPPLPLPSTSSGQALGKEGVQRASTLARRGLGSSDGQPETTYCEVEIEQRQGERRDITSLARLLRDGFNLVPSSASKFGRGLTLLYGAGIIGSGDQRVLAYDTVRDGVRHIVARHLHRLRLHDPGTRTGEDPESLHDMRVATRRLRAAVRVFAAGIPARLQDSMRRELQWLGQLLGPVRDLDVQMAKLESFTAAAPAGFRPALGCLREYMEGERARRRAGMLAGLDTARYFRLLLRLERFADARARGRSRDAAAQELIVVAGQRAIKRAFRRLIRRGDRIQATPHPEDLHALRIRAKRLRYLLEFLRELTGKPGRRLVKRLTALQDLLGSYQDAVVLADFVRVYVEGAGAQLAPSQLVALGALVAGELRFAEQKRTDFEATWHRFARPRTAADCRALLEKLRRLEAPPAREAATTATGDGGTS